MPSAYGKPDDSRGGGRTTELMRAVVTEDRFSVRTDAYTVAKTGSAEFETGKETHAWFTGFARPSHPGWWLPCWWRKAAAEEGRRRHCAVFDIYEPVKPVLSVKE